MKCEICHKAEAETAITVPVDGVARELYVCRACAQAARSPRKGRARTPQRDDRQPKITVVGGEGEDVPQPLVEEFVKATLGFMKGMAEAEEDKHRACPSCRATWETIKERGHVGCPACWKTFAREIRDEFLRAEYGMAHLGNAPAVEALADAESARTVLERDLKNAIAQENYRLAAEIKRRLDGLGADKEST